jgi:penicillin-binding protein 1C
LVHLDASGKERVTADCYPGYQMKHVSWFVLPPLMETYYKFRHPEYSILPPYKDGCALAVSQSVMEMVYPKKSNRIFIPVELDGKTGECIFEVAHHQPTLKIHWHLDDLYLGSTQDIHQMSLQPSKGKHTVTLVDENGERLEQKFEIIGH